MSSSRCVLPRTIKDVQRLTGRLAALSRFISRAGDKSFPFFRALRQAKDFKWDSQCEEAFQQLKMHIAHLPRLTSTIPGEPLGIYLATSEAAVSLVLVRFRNDGQEPIYYCSYILSGPEERYPLIKKLTFALILALRKQRPYFQAHPIKVVTDQPLRQILSKFDVIGRMLKWSVELGEFDLKYIPRIAMKAQALADFISESTSREDPPLTLKWTLYVDGSSNSECEGARLVLKGPVDQVFEHALRLEFKATNNEAEYEALMFDLNLTTELRIEDIKVFTDS
ncbi:hypothetical protein OPV22_006538 [Ensete ventricosum]|uniref:RNase H type-1 domain-containing protein n=1 Tax=Ensete ventricosum TaxID=4639 RepID=A0AAV8RLJ9_ENSVE|nr:hypothetical protein OPV22_006538 [Ensete ventricosum]